MRSAAIFLFFLLVAGFAQADEPSEASGTATDEVDEVDTPDGRLQRVKTALYVTRIEKIDFAAGTFSVEFYLTLTCLEAGVWCPKEFAVESGEVTKLEVVDEAPGFRVYRVKADINNEFDLSQYPLDQHNLPIEITHPTATAEELEFVIDEENSDVRNTVKVVGFHDIDFGLDVGQRHDEGRNADIPFFLLEPMVRRVQLASVMKGLMPPLFIVLVSSLGLLLRVKSVTNRIGMGTAGLLSAVMFHISFTSSLPPLGYLTLADKYMLASYLVLVANIVAAVLMLIRDDRGDAAGADAIYSRALVVIPLLAITAYSVVLTRLI